MKITGKSIKQTVSRPRTQEESSTDRIELTRRQNECSRVDGILSTSQKIRKGGPFLNRRKGHGSSSQHWNPTHALRNFLPTFHFEAPRDLPREGISEPKHLHQEKRATLFSPLLCGGLAPETVERLGDQEWFNSR